MLGELYWSFTSQSLYKVSTDTQAQAELVKLTSKQKALLQCLIDAYPKVIDKNDIIEAIWGSHAISPESLPQLINRTRIAIGDSDKSVIINHPGTGYSIVIDDNRPELEARPALQVCATEPDAPAPAPKYNVQSPKTHTAAIFTIAAVLIGITLFNGYSLASAIWYKNVFHSFFNAVPYQKIEKNDNTNELRVILDDRTCTYNKTNKILFC